MVTDGIFTIIPIIMYLVPFVAYENTSVYHYVAVHIHVINPSVGGGL